MTLDALHLQVARHKRKSSCLVLRYTERGRLESVDRMACLARPVIGPIRELALMRVLRMTVRAARERQRRLEVAVVVAGVAGNVRMFAQQRIPGYGMVESRIYLGRFPAEIRAVTGAARPGEGSLVGVAVTRCAVRELNAFVFHVWLRPRDFQVTLVAGHSLVGAGERKARPVVIEVRRVLPVGGVVAGFAFVGELPVMFIGVAVGAFSRQAKISPS